MSEKKLEIKIGFEKTIPSDHEKSYFSRHITDVFNQYPESVGLRNPTICYSILESNLEPIDYIWMTADYIARICWAFHAQKKTDYLDTVSRAFIMSKIGKIDNESVYKIIRRLSQEQPTQAKGLYDFFAFREPSLKKIESVLKMQDRDLLEYWCDGLVVVESDDIREQLSVQYEIKDKFYQVRSLQNPMKLSLVRRVSALEHFESLNLIIGLTLIKNRKDKNLCQKFFDVIFNSFAVFLSQPELLQNPSVTMVSVQNIVENEVA